MKNPVCSHPVVPSWKEIRDLLTNIQPVWPFFGLLTVAMVVMYGLSVANATALHATWPLVGFTLLMLAHTGLHWLSPLMGENWLRGLIYEAIQMLVVLALVALSHYEVLVFGLFMGLAGEVLGVVRPIRRGLVTICFLMVAVLALHGVVFGWASVSWSLVITIVFGTLFIVIYVYLFTRELEERERAEKLLKELEAAHRQLSEYAARIEELTLTNERQRMARELHDTLSQGLAGVILQLEAAGEHLEQGRTEKATAIIKQASGRARDTLAEARKVIDDLRNTTPLQKTLPEFIRGEAEHFTALTGLPCNVTCPNDLALPRELAGQIEKMVSEGLSNVVKHAHASKSWISLAVKADALVLEIGDDGSGFASEAAPSSGHYGLVGMRERARLAGGTFTIDSAAGQGTRLNFCFPLISKEEKKA